MDRPITTLFMLMSLDGKISTGAGDGLDFDRDLPRVPGVAEGNWIWQADDDDMPAALAYATRLVELLEGES